MNQRNAELDIDRLMQDNVSRYGFQVTGVLGDRFDPDYAHDENRAARQARRRRHR